MGSRPATPLALSFGASDEVTMVSGTLAFDMLRRRNTCHKEPRDDDRDLLRNEWPLKCLLPAAGHKECGTECFLDGLNTPFLVLGNKNMDCFSSDRIYPGAGSARGDTCEPLHPFITPDCLASQLYPSGVGSRLNRPTQPARAETVPVLR